MPDTRDIFLIDGAGFFEKSQKSFLGAPLLVVDGEDHTFLFGVIRDLLRLRCKLGINRGVFVVGEEAHQITTDTNIEKTIAFLQQLRIAVVHDSHARVLDLCVALASLANHVVTHDRSLLQLANDDCRVILLDNEDIEVFTSETVILSSVSRVTVCPISWQSLVARHTRC